MVLPCYPDARSTAIFLDFDGTLVEIVERPDAVAVADATRRAVATLAQHTDGALAIVTGRDIATIDAFVAPLRLPIAGVHGFARRNASGELQLPSVNDGQLAAFRRELSSFCDLHEGLIVESKAASVALHYRKRPELADRCFEVMERLVAAAPGFRLATGKMVLEAQPAGANKGAAVTAFMEEAPFKGRTPLFAGDDVTDEDAFAVVNATGGISIKVGEGQTAATFSSPSTADFLAWLVEYAEYLEGAENFERT